MYEEKAEFPELSKVLAVLLVEQGSYTYIDKLAQASSKDLALYHVRETLRDYNSLLNRGIVNEEAKIIADSINFSNVEKEVEKIGKTSSISDLREIVSLISAQALAEAARIRTRSTYSIGVKILDYLKSKGKSFDTPETLKESINSERKEIVEKLGIDEDIIDEIIENKSLLKSLIRRGGA
jgi:CRISPR-associated protein Csa5